MTVLSVAIDRTCIAQWKKRPHIVANRMQGMIQCLPTDFDFHISMLSRVFRCGVAQSEFLTSLGGDHTLIVGGKYTELSPHDCVRDCSSATSNSAAARRHVCSSQNTQNRHAEKSREVQSLE